MLLSLNWLKDFVNIPRNITPEELGLRLTMHTVEIDRVIEQADKFTGIEVGRILAIKKHPQADKLQLVKVDVGKEKLNIVCGAINIKAGDFVPVALTGTVLPNGLAIKEAEIRGVKSNGMLCAEDELEMGEDHSGIMILAKGKVGQNLAKHFKLDDTIFEVDNKSITHRPDLWGHFGMAREIGAFLGVQMTTDFKRLFENKIKIDNNNFKIKVKVEDKKLCLRYTAIAVEGIKIAESPRWMQKRLIAVGIRPINNIVDITNYVMLDIGQPMHAFNTSLVSEIIVRLAKKNEIIETLDGQERELDEDMLIIADGKKPIAVAGIMGGASSEIKKDTTSIIFEAANWEPVQIRKSARKLGLRTESSMRFEKSLDPNLCEMAIARAVELTKKVCPKAKVISNLVDIEGFNPEDSGQGPINLDLAWLERVIGGKIEAKKIIKILNNLGFEIKSEGEVLKVIVPTWRATKDISIPEDLVEEIVRIYGYDNLNPKMPRIIMQAPVINEERMLARKIKDILSKGARLTEVYNYSFVGEEQLKKLKMDSSDYIKLSNPIASQRALLRQSLAPNLLENIKLNQARYDNINLFEIGNIYLDSPGEINKDDETKDNLPYQEKRIGIIVAGSERDNVFVKIKGIVEYLLSFLNLEFNFEPVETFPGWVDRQAIAKIEVMGRDIGNVFLLDNKITSSLGIKKEIAVAEISFKELYNLVLSYSSKKYEEIAKYPPVIRDLAFVVNNKILYNDIKKEIENFSQLIKKVELFDVYQGEGLGKDKKNLAFHIIYQASDRTLRAEEIEEQQQKLIKILEKKFMARIRDF